MPVRVAWAPWLHGLLVSTNVPRTVYGLVDLCPQGTKGRPSVLHVPVSRGFGGTDLLPSLPGLWP